MPSACCRTPATALKASRKPIKLRGWRGRGPAPAGAPPLIQQRTDDIKPDMSLTMAQGMKRLGMPVAAFLRRGADRPDRDVVVPQPRRPARRRSRRRSAPSPGSIWSSRARSTSRCFRRSYVSFHDVGLKGGGTADPALQVDVLTANLRLLPLLLRRFEIADVMMLRPHIRVVRDGNGESNWTPFVETIARTMKPGAENQVSFSEIRIQDGVLNYRGRRQPRHRDSSATSTCRWPGRRSRARSPRPGSSTGAASASTARSAPAISSRCCRASAPGLKARLVSAPLKLAFDGTRRQPHQPDDGRHRDGRQPVAAQRAALDRTAAARQRRLRPLRAEGARQCGRRARSR